MARPVNVGEYVIYCDESGVDYPALVTAIHGPPEADYTCINLVHVVGSQNQHDQYGRQTTHESSVQRVSERCAHGNYWRFEEDARIPYREPIR